MSQIRETTHDPLKLWKAFSLPGKSRDLITVFMKTVVFLSLLSSILFFFYSTPTQSRRWPRCSVCVKNVATVEHLEKTNISHLLFGIGGSASTWKNRRHYNELWWKHNVTRGFVWLDENPSTEPWPDTSLPYRVSEDTSRFRNSNSHGSAIRIARIVVESFRLGLDNVRWFVLGDDDTVFFAENLVEVLSRYDHEEMYYVGGNSESVEQNMIHSYEMAFGGGGIAISKALVVQLVKVLDGCIDRYSDLHGSDGRIAACVNEIGVPLTRELGFHQVDIHHDPYGLLAAHPLAPLVSLHHLDVVKPIFPTGGNQIESLRTLISAYKVDPSRTLQQSFCYDLNRTWSVSVSWGYTVQIYSSLLTPKQLGTPLRTFKTWKSWQDGPFIFKTQPRSPKACERPVIFYLDHVDGIASNETCTSYKRNLGENGGECDLATYAPILALNTVNVSSLKMEPKEWNRARRRQCCEIVNNVEGALQIRVRSCGTGETVTPPQ